ncbi:hypothetical protein IAR55_004270 [Kwoniella newhampshirensis]|uniref:Uncharacterized protein n=1 Tax=Kwoniella newhampshirensis TaxID=1651941 RepID=A0AAW0YJA1_9TREE
MPPLRTRQSRASFSSSSQSQSQSLRRSSRHAKSGQSPALSDQKPAEDETFQTSMSSATLPNAARYMITLALPFNVELTATEAQDAYVRGEEILSDGWRRDTTLEGKLSDRRQEVRHAIGPVRLAGETGFSSPVVPLVSTNDPQTFWYTAGLAFPCVCSLRHPSRGYTPSRPPSIRAKLPPLPPHPNPSQIPRVGSYIFPWVSTISNTDLDPTLDDLEDFEPLWKKVSSTVVNDKHNDDSQATQAGLATGETPESRRTRKGKYRAPDSVVTASDDTSSARLLPARQAILEPEIQIEEDARIARPRIEVVVSAGPVGGEASWAEETKRRKKFWRRRIRSDSGYGYLWTFLSLPYSHPIRYFPLKPKRKSKDKLSAIPDFHLFRKYHSCPHPFHPDLPHYISANPRGRVYWLVPIHGPVLVPTLNHPLSPFPSTFSESPPTPSPAILHADDSLPPAAEELETKPRIIRWTQDLLLRFIDTFLHPLYLDPSLPFGNISYVFSGPKPDPFLDLPSSHPPKSHLHLPTLDRGRNIGDIQPVRVEAGDHLRIYCDVRKALALRTWLHNVKIPLGHPSKVGQEGEGRDELVRVFYKTRLALIGERNEVLMVA